MKHSQASEPDDAVTNDVQLDDFIDQRGRPHKFVRATWNYPRQLTGEDLMILSYFREHKILLDRNNNCVGFEGRAIDYADYATHYEKRGKRRRK